jgi:cyclopropane fatty-acyl-phospholipid synthase-like methyltransferase
VIEKASERYWSKLWEGLPIPRAVQPGSGGRLSPIETAFHQQFVGLLGTGTRSGRLLEIGCARSRWLPYFAKQFGYSVAGLDYSPVGCSQASEILKRERVVGTIVCADLFAPPEDFFAAFDVVVSFGVVEHFSDTTATIEALTRFLRPGGMLITTVPNLTGLIGWIQKRINKRIYDIHVPLDPTALANAYAAAGLQLSRCAYFMFTYFGVLNLNELEDGYLRLKSKRILILALELTSILIWKFEALLGSLPANRLSSPYVICAGQKAGEPHIAPASCSAV